MPLVIVHVRELNIHSQLLVRGIKMLEPSFMLTFGIWEMNLLSLSIVQALVFSFSLTITPVTLTIRRDYASALACINLIHYFPTYTLQW